MNTSIILPEPQQTTGTNTFVLTHLDMYNWGGFAHRHCAEINIDGTAIIGPTGSGKTTLVDALMTLITENPRYNLASTGGHESDRDLVSYIRGVSGAGNNSGDNEHIARPGKTVTGIAARFCNGETPLCIGAIFWLDGSSSAATDLKRLWIFSQAEGQGLDQWLEAHHNGGARQLKQMKQDVVGLNIDDSKKAYLAKLRNFFEVGENAFTLLNRAAGLKQLNSIDDIFRELVLDDRSVFQRAAEVAKEFDDLASIHNELEIARRQQQSLLPIEEGWKLRYQYQQELILQQELHTLLPTWYAGHGYRLWGDQVTELGYTIQQRAQELAELGIAIEARRLQTETLHGLYLQAGGAGIEPVRQQIETQKNIVEERTQYAGGYQRLVRRLKLDDALTQEALRANQNIAKQRVLEQEDAFKQLRGRAYELGVIQQRCLEERDSVLDELKQAEARPHSNIPEVYHRFRTELAQQLSLAEDKLPFVAELVEVKAEDSHWRGAIERAIGGHRLRILTPPTAMKEALRWINQRHNKIHVRLLELTAPTATANFLADGFTRKLNFKLHAYREALKQLLADLDRHCVDSADRLHQTPHALTEQGLMSGAGGFFEKQDQRPLSHDWVTGFDNRDRLALLREKLLMAEEALQSSQQEHEKAQQLADSASQQLELLRSLLQLEFKTIDQPGAERVLRELNDNLALLTSPDSDAGKAQVLWQEENGKLAELQKQNLQLGSAQAVAEEKKQQARASQQRSFQRLGQGLTEAQRELAEQHLLQPGAAQLLELDDLERKATDAVQIQIQKLESRLAACEKDLVREMGRAQKEDTGALSEVGTDMEDVPQYLVRLKVLTEEALPEKLQRFLAYLNQSSDQGVTQLLSDIDNEVSMIEERVEDLNSTLRRVDFQPGRYLRLDPQRIMHESLRTLQQAQRQLRSAVLKDDQGESHFKALQHMVELLRAASERRKVLGNLALLDPRYRLCFAISVIERGTGAVIETRTGSQGGSGGEKEIIASYVLTASLSYALCPPGSKQPLFGTIVLDEAFSKSSQVVAGRIISALSEFGLHPLFVTPNKELRLLRLHTRSAILVHRKGQQATLTSLSWEELEAHAKQRSKRQDEITK